jgi:hypothetical protein
MNNLILKWKKMSSVPTGKVFFISHRLQTKLINATSHCVIMKKHGGDIYFTLFNVPYIKPRDSYVNNFCRFKKKRKTTFNHLWRNLWCHYDVLCRFVRQVREQLHCVPLTQSQLRHHIARNLEALLDILEGVIYIFRLH